MDGSRTREAGEPGREDTGASRAHRTWPERLVVAAGVLTVLGLLTAASLLTYAYRKYERLPRVELSSVLDADVASGDPENYLLVGVDNASGLDPDDPVRRGRDSTPRSDTIMILRIDPSSRQAALLSLPRDLWVPIAGTDSNQRINTAIQRGGAELLIRTIDDYLGIPIHHYVQVDFASFQGLVEAVDGVPVYVEHPARDRNSGLVLEGQGCVTLDPEQALAYVRARHYQERIDGEWVTDASSDLGRISRQQDFIRRALRRAIDKGARDPRKLDELIDVALDGIVVDDSLTADDIFRLGNRFRSFEPEDLLSFAVPATGDMVGEAQVLRLDEEAAEPVLDIFRGGAATDAGAGGSTADGEPGSESGDSESGDGEGGDGGTAGEAGDVSPASVSLSVLNGSGESGQATTAAEDLRGAGFSVGSIGEAPSFDHERTVVQYAPDERDAADLVARYLAGGAEVEEVPGGAGIVVITGRDWEGVLSEPAEADGADGEGSSTTSTLLGAPSLQTTTTAGGGAEDGSGDGADGSGEGSSDGAGGTAAGLTSTTSATAAHEC